MDESKTATNPEVTLTSVAHTSRDRKVINWRFIGGFWYGALRYFVANKQIEKERFSLFYVFREACLTPRKKNEIFVQPRVDQGQQKTIARFENTIRCIGYRIQSLMLNPFCLLIASFCAYIYVSLKVPKKLIIERKSLHSIVQYVSWRQCWPRAN